MSSPWKLLRTITVADLGTTDLDMESLQTEGAGIEWADPKPQIPGVGPCEEYAFVVLAFKVDDTPAAATLTAQVVERAPAIWVVDQAAVYQYTGAAPETSLHTGRRFTITGRLFHQFTVRCSSVVGADATKLRVLYRPLR